MCRILAETLHDNQIKEYNAAIAQAGCIHVNTVMLTGPFEKHRTGDLLLYMPCLA
jgi:hypothetical protein